MGTPFKDVLMLLPERGADGRSPPGPSASLAGHARLFPPFPSHTPGSWGLTCQSSCLRLSGFIPQMLKPTIHTEPVLWLCPFSRGSWSSPLKPAGSPRQTWWLIEGCVAGGSAGWRELGIENALSLACPTCSALCDPTASCMRCQTALLGTGETYLL